MLKVRVEVRAYRTNLEVITFVWPKVQWQHVIFVEEHEPCQR